jgi:hypothetical protein
MRPALAPSFQKPGWELWFSFSAIVRSMEATSKTPPDVEHFGAQ